MCCFRWFIMKIASLKAGANIAKTAFEKDDILQVSKHFTPNYLITICILIC